MIFIQLFAWSKKISSQRQMVKAPPLLCKRENNHQNIQIGKLRINEITRRAELSNEDLFLTAAEFEVLLQLAMHVGNALSHDHIAQNTTGIVYDGVQHSIENIIRTLRVKLNDNMRDPQQIKSIHSNAYLLMPSAFDK
ncbi:MAG: hypothetical protein GY951_13935 [Psychromonas sp.]|nr:hypothetical protein [Alteromonadales bacterium]MCP5079141.1 hypothetical protein [Psychromonas sp.]